MERSRRGRSPGTGPGPSGQKTPEPTQAPVQTLLARVPRRPRRPMPEPESLWQGRDPRVALGERMNALRVARGISQEDFAARVGLDRTYVSGIERGLRNPTLLVLLRLAQALEVPVTELLEEPSPQQKGERPPAKR